jgi:hypothetical protein
MIVEQAERHQRRHQSDETDELAGALKTVCQLGLLLVSRSSRSARR